MEEVNLNNSVIIPYFGQLSLAEERAELFRPSINLVEKRPARQYDIPKLMALCHLNLKRDEIERTVPGRIPALPFKLCFAPTHPEGTDRPRRIKNGGTRCPGCLCWYHGPGFPCWLDLPWAIQRPGEASDMSRCPRCRVSGGWSAEVGLLILPNPQ